MGINPKQGTNEGPSRADRQCYRVHDPDLPSRRI